MPSFFSRMHPGYSTAFSCRISPGVALKFSFFFSITREGFFTDKPVTSCNVEQRNWSSCGWHGTGWEPPFLPSLLFLFEGPPAKQGLHMPQFRLLVFMGGDWGPRMGSDNAQCSGKPREDLERIVELPWSYPCCWMDEWATIRDSERSACGSWLFHCTQFSLFAKCSGQWYLLVRNAHKVPQFYLVKVKWAEVLASSIAWNTVGSP